MATEGGAPGRLVYPVHFLCPQSAIWPELRDGTPLPLASEIQASRSGTGTSAWVVQIYHALRAIGEDVSLSAQVRPERINVVYGRDFGRKARLKQGFFVVARADGHTPRMADFVVHQNKAFADGPASGYVPHWPQPGLVPRAPERGDTLRRLSYMGTARNLDPAFRGTSFREALAALGVELDLRLADGANAQGLWSDYSRTDAVLAVRGRGAYLDQLKPASKLSNAWLAGAPAILGPESSFRQLREDPLDYIEVSTPAEAVQAVKRLRTDPGLFAAMVAHGKIRAEGFTEAAIREQWIAMLNTRVGPRFRAWKASPAALRWVQNISGIAQEPVSKWLHKRRIRRSDRAG